MKINHIEILVEELSMEAFLDQVLPGILGREINYVIHVYRGKNDLLGKLESRLKSYAKWIPEDWRVIVLVDRDNQDCLSLKRELELKSNAATLKTKSSTKTNDWKVVNRIVIEEIEAWFFGEWEATRACYPRLSADVIQKAAYRSSDGVTGGTWEAFERVLKKAGYFESGLRKVECARTIGGEFIPSRCVSPSFKSLLTALHEIITSS